METQMNDDVKVLVRAIINWDWYLCVRLNEADKSAHIYYHDRWHRYEDRGSKPLANAIRCDFELLEDSHRIVYGLRIGKNEYTVTNPGHVFGYHDMIHYVWQD